MDSVAMAADYCAKAGVRKQRAARSRAERHAGARARARARGSNFAFARAPSARAARYRGESFALPGADESTVHGRSTPSPPQNVQQ